MDRSYYVIQEVGKNKGELRDLELFLGQIPNEALKLNPNNLDKLPYFLAKFSTSGVLSSEE